MSQQEIELIREAAYYSEALAMAFVKGSEPYEQEMSRAIKLRALADRMEQPVEAVGVVDESDDGLFADFETPDGVMVKRGDKLYLKPFPASAPAGVPDGWKPNFDQLKPKLMGEFQFNFPLACQCNQSDDCEICGGSGEYQHSVNVPWTVIKKILKAAAPTPQDSPAQGEKK